MKLLEVGPLQPTTYRNTCDRGLSRTIEKFARGNSLQPTTYPNACDNNNNNNGYF